MCCGRLFCTFAIKFIDIDKKIKPMQKKWTRETVFEESKKYSSRTEFKRESSGAFRIAYQSGWLDEMVWLVHPIAKPIKWTKNAVFEESRKYSAITEFMNNSVTAYTVARNNDWLTEMKWLAPSKRKPSGYWNIKDNVINESKRYNSLTEFQRKNSSAFNSAKINGWLDEMSWLSKTNRKPAGFWKNKKNVFEESLKYNRRVDFCEGCYLAYITAKTNGWLDGMTWLKKSRNNKNGYWDDKENVFREARKYKYKSDFCRGASTAYKYANKNDWLKEMTWFQPKGFEQTFNGSGHIVYVYIDDENKYAYVGATNDIKRRDYEHRSRNDDPIFKHFSKEGKEIPQYKILIKGLTVVERQREERIQSLYYRDVLHYKLINNINLTGENVGSLGSLIKKWTKKAVLREAEKYKTPTEFFTKSAGAYDAALKYKMMNKETFPWFYSNRMPPRWWNVKEHVFDESKKHKTWNEFFQKSPAAHFSARKHKWENEMTWLTRDQVPQGYWQNEQNVIEESKKYSTRTDFFKGCHAAYDYAAKHDLWEKIPWIVTKVKKHGYWTKERVFEEGAKYSTKKDFSIYAPTAYAKATRNKWIVEMTWFVSNAKPMGYWQNKQNVIEESHKYTSRSEFRWGTPSAYRSSIDNGWLDEMVWLKRPQNYNLKWTRENVFMESRKYDSRSAFKKGCASAYRVANVNGWLVEMIWLNKKIR